MPTIDYQSAIAILCVALAAAWSIRRMMKWASGEHNCETGCGKCGPARPDAPPPVVPLQTFKKKATDSQEK
ncbi:MAG TPA: FeoB-associated Cys-rich membrane protein [Caulifigura sp.]|nr:FeoB-associated Cys-rich membrane protein [Caulifigura sp.]